MSTRCPILIASALSPALRVHGEVPPQEYEYGFQLYQEDDNRIRAYA